MKLNEYKEEAETTVGFKILDRHTVRVNMMTFTGAMGHYVKISPEMKAYKEKISNMNIAPVASAQLYTPLYDYWYKKYQSDFGRAVGWSHMNSVIGGTAMHKFSPEKSCTKAEAINYIYRALK